MAEQLTLNQWVLGSSPRGRTSRKIPLILRNRRDFCVPHKYSFVVRGAYYPLCSCRGPVLAELGHPDVAAEDICTSACIGIRGALWSRRGCGRCAVVPCASRAWRTGAGEGCRLLDCCLMTGCFACGAAESVRADTLRALPENTARYRCATPLLFMSCGSAVRGIPPGLR